MSIVEFISYEPVKEEKHLGIVTVMVWGKMTLRYRVVPNKDGNGYFIAPASHRLIRNDEEIYLSTFVIESRSEDEEITQCIRSHLKKYNPLNVKGEQNGNP